MDLSETILVVAMTIWMEAQGEPHAGKVAVASVVWNRAEGERSKFVEVCFAPNQFAIGRYRNLKAAMAKPPSGPAWDDCLTIAGQMFNGHFRPTVPARFFHSGNLPKGWEHLEFICAIGGHRFYRGSFV
jgi:spore germination cell wall hydrolase CwlJ-like protein